MFLVAGWRQSSVGSFIPSPSTQWFRVQQLHSLPCTRCLPLACWVLIAKKLAIKIFSWFFLTSFIRILYQCTIHYIYIHMWGILDYTFNCDSRAEWTTKHGPFFFTGCACSVVWLMFSSVTLKFVGINNKGSKTFPLYCWNAMLHGTFSIASFFFYLNMFVERTNNLSDISK